MNKYRKLTEDEILRLKSQSCLADNWDYVSVVPEFTTEYVHHVRFSGEVKLGMFQSEFTLPGGIRKHSGLRHVTLHNVTVGDNCCIEHIQNYIANYEIGHDTFIENVDMLLVDEVSRFGNGVEVSVLNETGGREVLINDKLSAHLAYIMALYRHRPELIARLKEITDYYANKPDQPQGNKQKTHPYNIGAVSFCNAHINHRSHHKRHKQFKRRLQHLKERRQYGFFSVFFQID